MMPETEMMLLMMHRIQVGLPMMLMMPKTAVQLTNDVDDAKNNSATYQWCKKMWLTNDVDYAENESIGTEEGQVGSISVAINRLWGSLDHQVLVDLHATSAGHGPWNWVRYQTLSSLVQCPLSLVFTDLCWGLGLALEEEYQGARVQEGRAPWGQMQ